MQQRHQPNKAFLLVHAYQLRLVHKACNVDHAGDAVLEYLLLQLVEQCVVLGPGNSTEANVIGSWYLWWERRKLVHNEMVQEPKFPAMSLDRCLCLTRHSIVSNQNL